MVVLFVTLSDDDADTCLVILAAAGIACRISGHPDSWSVSVSPGDIARSLAEIESYFQENHRLTPAPDAWSGSAVSSNLHFGLGAALGLLAGHVFMIHHGGLARFAERYGASASAILNGELHRSVTALMVHAGPVHLVGNMAALCLLVAVVCSIQGYGAGAFGLLSSGALGNYLNALLHRDGHVSVGASTAVFGAVGILISHQIFKGLRTPARRVKAWVPLGGGLCLLGLFSQGAHTDILAHLFGLAAGLTVGCIYEALFRKPPDIFYQHVFFMLTLGLVLTAWMQ